MEYVKQKRKKREISAASQASLAEKKIIRSITYIYIYIDPRSKHELCITYNPGGNYFLFYFIFPIFVYFVIQSY